MLMLIGKKNEKCPKMTAQKSQTHKMNCVSYTITITIDKNLPSDFINGLIGLYQALYQQMVPLYQQMVPLYRAVQSMRLPPLNPIIVSAVKQMIERIDKLDEKETIALIFTGSLIFYCLIIYGIARCILATKQQKCLTNEVTIPAPVTPEKTEKTKKIPDRPVKVRPPRPIKPIKVKPLILDITESESSESSESEYETESDSENSEDEREEKAIVKAFSRGGIDAVISENPKKKSVKVDGWGVRRVKKPVPDDKLNDPNDPINKARRFGSIGAPIKPRKLTAYELFTLDTRPTLVAENPNSNAREITILIGKKWEELKKSNDTEYARYQNLAAGI